MNSFLIMSYRMLLHEIMGVMSYGHLPPVKHCDFNLSVWLGASHNLSHKASTIHQTSSWNEHIYEHVTNCVVLSISTVFLTGATRYTSFPDFNFACRSSIEIQVLENSPLTCLKHLGIAPMRGLIVAKSGGECAISSAVIIFNFQVIFPKTSVKPGRDTVS